MRIEIDGLSRTYDGGVVGLHPLSLVVADGVFALLGPNGAGKSTLMTMLSTLLEPSAGTAIIDGHDLRRDKDAVRRILGYLPQDFGLYPSLTVWETLDYIGLLYNMEVAGSRHKRIADVMARVNLGEVRDRPVGQLSGGMRQRVGLAQALLNSPKLLIVDEPTAGLDPEERIRVRSLLAELGRECVVLLSTHVIEDVAAVADRIGVLHKGRLRFEGTAEAMRACVDGKVWEIAATPERLSELRGRYVETSLQRDDGRVRVRFLAETIDDPDAKPVAPTLDDAFIWLMQEASSVD